MLKISIKKVIAAIAALSIFAFSAVAISSASSDSPAASDNAVTPENVRSSENFTVLQSEVGPTLGGIPSEGQEAIAATKLAIGASTVSAIGIAEPREGTKIALIQMGESICAIAIQGGTSINCAPEQVANEVGFYVTVHSASGQKSVVIGAVPDGVEYVRGPDSSVETVVESNVFYIESAQEPIRPVAIDERGNELFTVGERPGG